jgi:hypothetical protein
LTEKDPAGQFLAHDVEPNLNASVSGGHLWHGCLPSLLKKPGGQYSSHSFPVDVLSSVKQSINSSKPSNAATVHCDLLVPAMLPMPLPTGHETQAVIPGLSAYV